jgi:phosphatidylinositol alpha-1,6-mannosyltransferase
MQSNKLLFFSYDFPPLEGGISRLCDEIVKQFIKNRWDVEALSKKIDIKKGFQDVKYPIQRVSTKRFIRELESYNILKTYPKDILVITGVWHPEALLAILAGHKNVIVLAHGNDIMKGKNTFKNKILSILRKWVLTKSKLVICNSHYTQRVIKEQFSFVNTTVCTLGVDEKRFVPIEENSSLKKELNLPQNKKIVLTISRINRYKAHDVVLKALSLLDKDTRENLCYCIAGRGDYLEDLKKLAIELDVEDCIYWYGFIDEDDLVKLYQSADLFVLCTREEKDDKEVEGFGLVFLEAQACGIPVIGAKQGGIPDAVKENEGGWLIDRDDSHALANYLVELVQNEKKFTKEGIKGRIRVEREATWSQYGANVLEKINNFQKK